MRPPVHMPLPAIMITPLLKRLIAMDSSGVGVDLRIGSQRSA